MEGDVRPFRADWRTLTLGPEVIAMLTYDVQLVELEPQHAAVVRGHVKVEELPAFLGGAFGEVIAALSAQGLAPAGPPFGRYRPTDHGFDAEVGFPATGPVTPRGRVVDVALPGGTAAQVLHRGDYAAIAPAYGAIEQWLRDHGYVHTDAPWESYLDGPEVAEPRTWVVVPCRARDRRGPG
jgi:effector-binding domain-containing protein